MLMVTMFVLLAGNVYGLAKFRNLSKSIRERSTELPVVATLGQKVSELRSELWRLGQSENSSGFLPFELTFLPQPHADPSNSTDLNAFIRLNVRSKLNSVEKALDEYQHTLEDSDTVDRRIAVNDEELEMVVQFREGLKRISHLIDHPNKHDNTFERRSQIFSPLESELAKLQTMVTRLPIFMQDRMEAFSRSARSEFQAIVTASIGFGLFAFLTIGYLIWGFRKRIAQPLETLVAGSRQVAAGNFEYRIVLNSNDEVAELGDALNEMTSRFQAIKSDLNQQVQQRTKEVVRSEKMASVGFLAAGVAHEINNPLASIAWSAESLEMRLTDILAAAGVPTQDHESPDVVEMLKYLRRIQDEAFRCKGITAGLLDFSRMGDVKKTATRLAEIVESVIEMVRPLSKYRDRNIHVDLNPNLECVCNAQEMKQVVLNLITNALGSVDPGGTVKVELSRKGKSAQLRIVDDGCGMSEEVLTHLFEPFFTRRRDGQGTGLGLSITYQIIAEHGGQIVAQSAGTGQGSTFIVNLPMVNYESSSITKAAA